MATDSGAAVALSVTLLSPGDNVLGAVDGAVSLLDAAGAVALDAQSHVNLEVKGLS
jgi:hypothetical protein